MHHTAKAMLGVALALSEPALAIDCSDIRPTPPQSWDTSGGIKLEGSVDGIFKRLVNPHAEIDAKYRKVASDVMPQFPNADQVYVWERGPFMQCQVLNEDKTIATKDKLDQFSKLLTMYNQPPPPLVAAPGSNTISNSGNNVNAIQGSGNSVSVGSKP